MKKILSTNKGMTLLEVLLVLVILSIVSVTIYSTFTTGLKLYQKIAIEGQLRDDADFIATNILSELYENTPHYIEPYIPEGSSDAIGIRMVRYIPKKIDRYVIEQATDQFSVKKAIYFEGNKFFIKDELENSVFEVSSETSVHTTYNVEGKEEISFIEIDENNCSQKDSNGKCQHGVINLTLVLKDSKERYSSLLTTEPIVLKSSFGF